MSNRRFLRLIHDTDSSGHKKRDQGRFEPIQDSLISADHKVLFVCTTEDISEHLFINLISKIRPGFVFDLRAAPRFDFGSLNRRKALTLFEEMGGQYFDLGYNVSSEEDLISKIRLRFEEKSFLEYVFNTQGMANALVIVDPISDYRLLGFRLVHHLREATKLDWEVILYGPNEETKSDRRLIFISHANPEDNEFVLWLQAQLTRYGYEVWSDLTALKGGETIWDTIEEIIRKKAAKVLVVVSRAAMQKPGVLDEISLSVSVERTEKISSFVIPLRLDLPFSEFRANIARKAAIDYSENWSRGMTQLLEELNRAQIPRSGGFGRSDLDDWLTRKKVALQKIKTEPEDLVSNQFNVEKMPYKLHLLLGSPAINGDSSFETISRFTPLVPFQGAWLSLLSEQELWQHNISGMQSESAISIKDLIEGNLNISKNASTVDCRRLLHRILNRQWEWFLTNKGLIRYWVPHKPSIMYFPTGLIEKDKIDYVDINKSPRWRSVVGFSQKRKIYWHLGVTGRFIQESSLRMQLKLSVIFTEDGTSNLINPNKMKDARRRFCKNWWNDRWCGLQHAAMNWISEESESAIIYNGSSGTLSISSMGQVFKSSVSIQEEMPNTTVIDSEVLDFDEFFEFEENEIEGFDDGILEQEKS